MDVRGVSLIELLVALLIAAVLLQLALPAWSTFQGNRRAVAAINTLIASVQLARTSAVVQGVTVTFCPRSGAACGSRADWTQGGLIFADANRNARIDEGEVVYGGLPPLDGGATLQWRAFRNRSYLQFRPSGLTDWQNGSFLYCPADGDARFARAIILNVAGRVRRAPDRNQDGIAEDAQGRPLVCQ
ncbi:MAG: GspH/FimT family pseudopilin [Pseudomonadales bacterium]|nr:GspH/FimT family pseudopilin [Pseudomonadales bacterium]